MNTPPPPSIVNTEWQLLLVAAAMPVANQGYSAIADYVADGVMTDWDDLVVLSDRGKVDTLTDTMAIVMSTSAL